MNERTCPRTWEVEAARDGRLSEAACTLLEEHVARCEICARERRALAELASRLRSDLPAAPDDLSVRRLRRATLEKANAAWLERGQARESSPWARRRPLSLAGAVVLAGALAALAWWTPWRPAGPTVQVTEGPTAADWTRDAAPGVHRVVLREGAIELRIERQMSDAPFFVVVPDGEIQDVGTVFRVEVKSGATTAIDVTEGAVVFRRPDHPDVRVGAGEHWPHPIPAGAGGAGAREPGSAPNGAPAPATTGEAPGTQTTSAPDAPGASATGAAPSEHPAPPGAATTTPTASALTAKPAATAASAASAKPAATTASAAAAKPAASSKPATSGGLEEDLAYLRVIALLRDGRREEARLAAKEYLRRFPRGFRRVEVEGIAR